MKAPLILDAPTPESIAAAKQAQQAERAATGLQFDADGHPLPPPAKAVIIRCPRCQFHAAARTEGRAVGSLAAHLVRHLRQGA